MLLTLWIACAEPGAVRQSPPSDPATIGSAPTDSGPPPDTSVGPTTTGPATTTATGCDAAPAAWHAGPVDRPALVDLDPLPGGGVGGPVLTSNNPEVFEGPGLLYGNARPSPTRGGGPVELVGDFGVYLHHLNRAGRPLTLHLLVTNPNVGDVTVDIAGTGLQQGETGGLGLGTSPDYRVSEDWILGTPEVVDSATIAPFTAWSPWSRLLGDGAEVDGRFAVTSSDPVFVYVVATETGDVNEAVNAVLFDAPGDYRISGDPPPPYGREAGVYRYDTWVGEVPFELSTGPGWAGVAVNTATGSGHSQVQAFGAIGTYDGAAQEAVGMYGNVYDLTTTLRHDGATDQPLAFTLQFGSLTTAALSRYWDGVALLDGVPIDIRHTPEAPTTVLTTGTLDPGACATFRLKAMVPGLTSIPQALWVEVE